MPFLLTHKAHKMLTHKKIFLEFKVFPHLMLCLSTTNLNFNGAKITYICINLIEAYINHENVLLISPKPFNHQIIQSEFSPT